MGRFDDFGEFCGRHWGDCVALFILSVGVGIELVNSLVFVKWQVELPHIHELSAGLVSAALFALRLVPKPKNGNGHSDSNGGSK